MCSLSADNYGGWEVYPENMALGSLEVDASRRRQRINEQSRQLFVSNNESSFEHLGLSVQEKGEYVGSSRSSGSH